MNVDEMLADVAQRGQGHCDTIDPTDTATSTRDLPTQDQITRSREKPQFLEKGPQQGKNLPRQTEHPFHNGTLGATANQIDRCTRANQQANRIDNDRLAGTGLARKDIEPWPKP